MVRGKFDSTITDRMQLALGISSDWCEEKGLSINPKKTTLGPFTRRKKLSLGSLNLGQTNQTYSDEIKYLGVILDKSLTWNSHLSYISNKALKTTFACQRLYGKTWGLKLKMTAWLYRTITVPMITNASLAWWPKIEQDKAQTTLNRVHRVACLGVTEAIRTCPSAALGALTVLKTPHLAVKETAARAALRLPQLHQLKEGNLTGHLKILKHFWGSPCLIIPDKMGKILVFTRIFNVIINDRAEWRNSEINQDSQLWFTDGSKMEDGSTGAGIVGPHFQKAVAMGKTASIFQAEVHALELCGRECLRRGLSRAKLCILSDSQAALRHFRVSHSNQN